MHSQNTSCAAVRAKRFILPFIACIFFVPAAPVASAQSYNMFVNDVPESRITQHARALEVSAIKEPRTAAPHEDYFNTLYPAALVLCGMLANTPAEADSLWNDHASCSPVGDKRAVAVGNFLNMIPSGKAGAPGVEVEN